MITTESFLQLLGRVSLQASGLVLIVMGAQFVFRRWLSPRWRCALWWLVAVRLIIPVSPQSSFSIFNVLPDNSKVPNVASQRRPVGKSIPQLAQPPISAPSAAQEKLFSLEKPIRNIESEHQEKTAMPPQPTPVSTIVTRRAASPVTIPSILFALWLTGVVALASQLLIATFRLHRRLNGLAPVTDNVVLDRLNHCRSQMGVSKSLQIFETSSVTSPALYGFLHPRLLLPLQFTRNFSDEEQTFVFLHELAHVKRHDILLNWVLAGMQVVHWFNPFLWIAAFRFRTDRELACDALALDRAGEAHSEAYGRTILRLLQDFTRPATVPALVGILEDKRQLKRRITAIANFSPIKRGAWLAMMLLATLSALALTDAKDSKPKLPPVVPVPLDSVFTKGENELYFTNKVWLSVPKGTQDFGGIEFHVDGVIQLLSKGFQGEGRDFRTKVLIPLQETNKSSTKQVVINRGTNVSTIHLIGGSAYDDVAGTKTADIVWHYADKTTRRTPIEVGIHVRDWLRGRYEEPAHLSYPYTKVVWTGSHPDVDKQGKRLRFYRMSFANPQPQKEVKAIEFQSPMNRPGLYIAAVTLDPMKLGERPDDSPDLEESDPPLTGVLQATVTDSEGKPLAGAKVEGKVRQDAGKPTQASFTKSFVTDSNGMALVLRPVNGLERFEVVASKDGFGGQKMIWDMKTGDTVPATYSFKLQGGITIGGTVVNANGDPISAASVSVTRFWTGGENIIQQGADVDFQTKKELTDNAGKWAARNVPPELLSHIMVLISHPDYTSTNFYANSKPEFEKALRTATLQVTMAQGLQALGRVLDENNNPIAGATVSVNRRSTRERQDVNSDSEGRFSFKNVAPGDLVFSATAKGRKPMTKSFPVTGGMEEILLIMTPGTTVRARVQNEGGQPVPNTRVALESPTGGVAQTYDFHGTTDEEGRIVWDGAPDEPQKYYFGGPGYEQKRGQVLQPNVENIVTLHKARQLQGRVIAAGTGEPVKKFSAGVGRGYGSDISRFYPDSPGFVQFSNDTGEFTITLHEEQNNTIVVNAPDYADKLQTLPAAVDGVIQITIELLASPALEGIVVLPDGRPCPGVGITVTAKGGMAQTILSSGQLKGGGRILKIAITDKDGRFKLSSPPESGIVLAASALGFSSVSLEQVRAVGGLVLQPYGRVEGILYSAGEPAAGIELVLTRNDVTLMDGNSSVKTTTDANGHFKFESVPSGKVSISRLVAMGSRSWMHSHATDVAVESGKTATITLGDSGGVLRGNIRFETPLDPALDVTIVATLTPKDRVNIPKGMTPSQTTAYLESEEGQKLMRANRPLSAPVLKNGLLQLDSVMPGSYQLSVSVNRNDGDLSSASLRDRAIARGETSVTVPAEATPSSPLNIGEILLKPTGSQTPKQNQQKFSF